MMIKTSMTRYAYARWYSSSGNGHGAVIASLVYEHACKTPNRVAIHSNAESYTYQQLLKDSNLLEKQMTSAWRSRGQSHATGTTHRVAALCTRDYWYVVTMLATWRANGVFVPLSESSPVADLQYYVDDSEPSVCVISPHCKHAHAFNEYILSRRLPYVLLGDTSSSASSSSPLLETTITPTQPAMIVYTSGTTGRPKGVVHTHASLHAQVTSLVTAWQWTANDRVLNVLPMHHVHGIVNVLLCALASGAVCEFQRDRSAVSIINALCRHTDRITLMMAVPTIYANLMKRLKDNRNDDGGDGGSVVRAEFARQCSVRLMVSGSAALPVPVFNAWKSLTGYTLLERYGMTEFGMALSNPLEPVANRRPGCVGVELPGVTTKIVADASDLQHIGELYVRGPAVFSAYWNRPQDTSDAFDGDGWFRTGDIVEFTDGVYRVLGRRSVDIIKFQGYKLSALEIEANLLEHPSINECVIIGVPDDYYGECLTAIITTTSNVTDELTTNTLYEWAKSRLPPYKIPRRLHIVERITRNAMGKVNKKELIREFAL